MKHQIFEYDWHISMKRKIEGKIFKIAPCMKKGMDLWVTQKEKIRVKKLSKIPCYNDFYKIKRNKFLL